MKIGFYPRLAADGIRKNKRMYIPYILTCTGMVMMYYIITFLQYSDTVLALRGGSTIAMMMGLGSWVIAVFAVIFLFYTNSFLIRRRKKEFGLYNILGMGKHNIGIILFFETLIVALISLTAGLAAGITFSKLAELGLVNVMKGNVTYDLSVSPIGVVMSLLIFNTIYLLIYINSLIQIRKSSAISLMKSESNGERPPRANWFIGILGIIILAAAYYIAVSVRDPLAAIVLFFIAVIMVIIATYMIMISGSVLLCRVLQKKKSYYYKPNHFVSVSSMAYRMKRNGAGLASICILATMVLVMISSTSCLYFGSEDALRARYPREINLYYNMTDPEALNDENIGALRNAVYRTAADAHGQVKNVTDWRSVSAVGYLSGTEVETDRDVVYDVQWVGDVENVCTFYFVPLADYNSMTGANETLEDGEAMISLHRTTYTEDVISFTRGESYKIKKQVDEFTATGEISSDITATIIIVVPDLLKAVSRLYEYHSEHAGIRLMSRWQFGFDTGLDEAAEKEVYLAMRDILCGPAFEEEYSIKSRSVEWRTANSEDFYATYGGFFYLGIILSIVFIFAAVLIIYYKQISEGYEDQSRFRIMQNVGMTKAEIRKSINSQLLTVFFLPLVLAGVHLAFAFPMINKLLWLFNFSNIPLFIGTTLASFAAFTLLYTLIYRVTSNAYYNIVSGARE